MLFFNFKNKSKVSMNDDSDYAIINFWGAPLIRTDDNQPVFSEPFALRVRIPLITEKGHAQVATKAAGVAIKGGG